MGDSPIDCDATEDDYAEFLGIDTLGTLDYWNAQMMLKHIVQIQVLQICGKFGLCTVHIKRKPKTISKLGMVHKRVDKL